MSTSNIIVKVRYQNVANRGLSIKRWGSYVSKKEKADSVPLDQNNSLVDYLNYSDNDSFLLEKEENFLWTDNGDINLGDLLNNVIDDKGLIWDMVISFNQNFAFNNGLITKKDFYDLSKKIMPTFLVNLGFDLNNVSWFAGLHRNTNNPHIHLVFFEHKIHNHFKVIPQANIKELKSVINNYLIDNTKFYELRDNQFKNITNLISIDELTKVKNQKLFPDKYRRDLNKMLLELYSKLPKKGRLQYNSKNMDSYRTELNFIIDYILMNDPIKTNYQFYYNLLEEHQKELIANYGYSEANKNNKYIEDQKNKLYSKIGNEILNNFKIYDSKDAIDREITFLKKHIYEMKFKSNEYNIDSKGKSLYKICTLCSLNSHQISKVFKNWMNNSNYNNDLESVITTSKNSNMEISISEYYKILKQLGYDFERYSKFKNKNFYKELNYKVFINRANKHLMYEYEREQKSIEKELEYELEGL